MFRTLNNVLTTINKGLESTNTWLEDTHYKLDRHVAKQQFKQVSGYSLDWLRTAITHKNDGEVSRAAHAYEVSIGFKKDAQDLLEKNPFLRDTAKDIIDDYNDQMMKLKKAA